MNCSVYGNNVAAQIAASDAADTASNASNVATPAERIGEDAANAIASAATPMGAGPIVKNELPETRVTALRGVTPSQISRVIRSATAQKKTMPKIPARTAYDVSSSNRS